MSKEGNGETREREQEHQRKADAREVHSLYVRTMDPCLHSATCRNPPKPLGGSPSSGTTDGTSAARDGQHRPQWSWRGGRLKRGTVGQMR